MHLICSICSFDFNLLFKLGTKLNKLNQNGTVSERYKAISEEAETKTCFYSVYYLQTNHKHFKSSYLVSLYFFHVFVYGNNSQSTACFMSLTYSRNKKGPNIKDRNTRIFTLNVYSKTSIWKVRLKPVRKSKSRHFLSKMSWFMVSKAFSRSMRIIPVNRPESKPVSIFIRQICKRSVCWVVLAKPRLVSVENLVLC